MAFLAIEAIFVKASPKGMGLILRVRAVKLRWTPRFPGLWRLLLVDVEVEEGLRREVVVCAFSRTRMGVVLWVVSERDLRPFAPFPPFPQFPFPPFPFPPFTFAPEPDPDPEPEEDEEPKCFELEEPGVPVLVSLSDGGISIY